MVESSGFDVFLAHNSADKLQVRAIAESLKQRGLNPWLDEEQIIPGQIFQVEIQKAIQKVTAAIIFIGSQGLGKWQTIELPALYSQFVKAENITTIIPVLLPGVNKLPQDLLFLAQHHWVSFYHGIDDIKALDTLVWGITGQKPKTIPSSEQKPGKIRAIHDIPNSVYRGNPNYMFKGIPNYILEHKEQPAIAVFEDLGESYALGCPALRNLWSGVPVVRALSDKHFNEIANRKYGSSRVVADIPCNASVLPFAPQNEPGAIVLLHDDGKYYRHYVDSIEFFTAIGTGNLIPISQEDFYKSYPDRGTDFKVYR